MSPPTYILYIVYNVFTSRLIHFTIYELFLSIENCYLKLYTFAIILCSKFELSISLLYSPLPKILP